ncbi:MAG: hypothetical protein MUF34_15890 [Polyangiaceae bacterium]|jgi:hypothetical protein|nr:hypothetical protein [Polyangiaceae bacterium]
MSESGAPRSPSNPPTAGMMPTLDDATADTGELASLAMILREEQIQARIIHYKAELDTSPELDAITARVVEQLKALQAHASQERRAPWSVEAIEAEQAEGLGALLGRVFRKGSPSVLVEHNLKNVARRVTRMFFEAELAERADDDRPRARLMRDPEQALYFLLRRYENRMLAELEGFTFADDDVRRKTFDALQEMTNEFRVSFLSRRSPELKRLIATLHEVLLDFFQSALPPTLPAFSADVVRQSGSSTDPEALGYKVSPASFPQFRQAFERRFLERLVEYVQPLLGKRMPTGEGGFRDETIAFAQSPRLYSNVCSLFCDAVYDFLCNEGFLDLPIDWRSKPAASP